VSKVIVKKAQTNLDDWMGQDYLNQLTERNMGMHEMPYRDTTTQSTFGTPSLDTPPISNQEHQFQLERILDNSKYNYPLSQNVPTQVPGRGTTTQSKRYGFGGVKSAQRDILEHIKENLPYDSESENRQFTDWINSMTLSNNVEGSRKVASPRLQLNPEKWDIMPESFRDLTHPQTTLPEFDWGMQSERWLDDKGNPIPGAIPPVNAVRLASISDMRDALNTRSGLVPKSSSFSDFERNMSNHKYPFYIGEGHPGGGKGFFITSADKKNLNEAVTPHQSNPTAVGIRGFRHDTPLVQSRPRTGQSENVNEAFVSHHIPQEKLVVPRTSQHIIQSDALLNDSTKRNIVSMIESGVSPEEIFEAYSALLQHGDDYVEADGQSSPLRNIDLMFDYLKMFDKNEPEDYYKHNTPLLGGKADFLQNLKDALDPNVHSRLDNLNDYNEGNFVRIKPSAKQTPTKLTLDEDKAIHRYINRANIPRLPEFYRGIVDDKSGLPIIDGKVISHRTLIENPDLIPAIAKYYEHLNRIERTTLPPSWGSRIKQLEDMPTVNQEEYKNWLLRQ